MPEIKIEGYGNKALISIHGDQRELIDLLFNAAEQIPEFSEVLLAATWVHMKMKKANPHTIEKIIGKMSQDIADDVIKSRAEKAK